MPWLMLMSYISMYMQVSTLDIFLVEVNLAAANSMLSFVLKCENAKLAPPFMQHFFGALVCCDIKLMIKLLTTCICPTPKFCCP